MVIFKYTKAWVNSLLASTAGYLSTGHWSTSIIQNSQVLPCIPSHLSIVRPSVYCLLSAPLSSVHLSIVRPSIYRPSIRPSIVRPTIVYHPSLYRPSIRPSIVRPSIVYHPPHYRSSIYCQFSVALSPNCVRVER